MAEDPYDVAILRAFIHVPGPERARQALKHVTCALKSGGKIYIAFDTFDEELFGGNPAVICPFIRLSLGLRSGR